MFCPKCGSKNRDTASFCIFCGHNLSEEKTIVNAKMTKDSSLATPAVATIGAGSVLDGRYIITRQLAAGGMGKLWLADDKKMSFPVVIKEMIQASLSEKKLKYIIKRFKQEARLLFRLKHKSLPRVVDFFNWENNFYMIMEYVEGKNLSEILGEKPNGRFEVSECFILMARVLDIIIYLHNQDPPIIHRDIKPGNIMLAANGEVLLVDFGLARPLEEGKEGTARVGTHGFASPEHHTGKFHKSSDLYSFGATFHYILSGEDPRKRMPFIFPPLSDYRDDVPAGLQNITERLLKLKYRNRYQRAEEVSKDMEKIKKECLRVPHKKNGQERGKILDERGETDDEPVTILD